MQLRKNRARLTHRRATKGSWRDRARHVETEGVNEVVLVPATLPSMVSFASWVNRAELEVRRLRAPQVRDHQRPLVSRLVDVF
jgi:hypothetical protein